MSSNESGRQAARLHTDEERENCVEKSYEVCEVGNVTEALRIQTFQGGALKLRA